MVTGLIKTVFKIHKMYWMYKNWYC